MLFFQRVCDKLNRFLYWSKLGGEAQPNPHWQINLGQYMQRKLGLIFRILITLRNRQKVFCIGNNKTGTTSLYRALKDLGYVMGNQATAELLIQDYAKRNFNSIIEYCHTAEAFQDLPFSLPYTYILLDYAFPGSKFILSIRDDENEWYKSLIRFHMKRLNIDRIQTKQDLMNDEYRYRGYRWEANRIIFETPEEDPYNEEILKKHYIRHNEDVIRYFRFRDNLLVINLKDTGSYLRFCEFLRVQPRYENFPWLNRSS